MEYENGFGQLGSNFWIGLKLLHQISVYYASKGAVLRVDMSDCLQKPVVYEEYKAFSVE
jgi:hypothetical protein